MAGQRTQEQVKRDLEAEREQLAASVAELRGSLRQATNVGERLKGKLPALVGAAASAGFVFGGGIGATARFFARRSRER